MFSYFIIHQVFLSPFSQPLRLVQVEDDPGDFVFLLLWFCLLDFFVFVFFLLQCFLTFIRTPVSDGSISQGFYDAKTSHLRKSESEFI